MRRIKKIFFYLSSFLFLSVPNFLWATQSAWYNSANGGNFGSSPYGLSDSSVLNIIEVVMRWLLSIVGFLGVIGFVIAGIIYVVSVGDDDRVGAAKKAMLFSIIGMIIALLGLVILTTVSKLIEGHNANL